MILICENKYISLIKKSNFLNYYRMNNNPTKIIWKYKNNNRKVQYNIYVYLGRYIDEKIKEILVKIENLSLLNALLELTLDEYKTLEIKYGIFWYNFFYNTYHINYTINNVNETEIIKKKIINHYGSEWYKIHFEQKQISSKIFRSYETLIKIENINKKKSKAKAHESDESDETLDLDYTTLKQKKIEIVGGNKTENANEEFNERNNDEDDENEDTKDVEDSEIKESEETDLVNKSVDGEDNEDNETDVYEDIISDIQKDTKKEDITEEEIQNLYSDVTEDPNIDKTSDMIIKAMEDEEIIEKTKKEMIVFDNEMDNNAYDVNLKDVYKKKYVFAQFIYQDNTIKNIKNKICCSIKNNDKFGENAYILPSRQYLWGEYTHENEIKKIMIGQKWMRRNELLKIDVEPNNNTRIYGELIGNIKQLRDDLKRFGSKAKWEDDDNNLLYDYSGYFTNNEIFMIDIYNELGLNYQYNEEFHHNVIDTYLKLYFHRIKSDEYKYIVEFLNGEKKNDQHKMISVYENLNNDLIIENEIVSIVENEKKEMPKYADLYKKTYIIQSVIHANISSYEKVETIDLFKIFNNFKANKKYPFLQYQTNDGKIILKFNKQKINKYLTNKDKTDLITKWFENAPYGLSFKILIEHNGQEKLAAIDLNEYGRIQYKALYKEEDNATTEDIETTYGYVRELIKKLNDENPKIKLNEPRNEDFGYAFINSIQKFELMGKHEINHNDFSDFCRLFYPYIALIIEPRKRHAKFNKESEKGKFGTYLRYKLVSKYENQAKIEQRIFYIMKNYEFTEHSLINEISQEFNLTEKKALEYISNVKLKNPTIRKSRLVLKKISEIPRHKPSGIEVEIQGKTRDKYKIRISGARNIEQMTRITLFINTLITLYYETYLEKNEERQILKEKLKKLSDIAKRRRKVDEFVKFSSEEKKVKQMGKIDKIRIGFKPDKGQNQYTRSCQNSGNNVRRLPQQYKEGVNINDMYKLGYKLNRKTGEYERIVTIKDGKKKHDVKLRTIKLAEYDENGNLTKNQIHYACDPTQNGKHTYVGFLSKSANPFGQCMPCCFSKNQAISNNKERREHFENCLKKANGETTKIENKKIIGDVLYVLQDTNKIHEGRIGNLPRYLDIYLNKIMNNERKIKHHYLIRTHRYFFKMGVNQDEYQYLNVVASAYETTPNEIINKIIKILENDKKDYIFNSLNNGDIRTQFSTRENFINFVKTNRILDFNIINDILMIPGILSKYGTNIIVFNRKINYSRRGPNTQRDDLNILCPQYDLKNYITEQKRDNILLLKEGKYYYLIVKVIKTNENDKNLDIEKIFKYENNKNNIINHITDFFIKSCEDETTILGDTLPGTHTMYRILKQLDKKYNPKTQIIDLRNKVRFFVLSNGLLLPVKQSGSLYELPITSNIDNYLQSFDETLKNLLEINKILDKNMNLIPTSIYYDKITDNEINVISIKTNGKYVIPVKAESINKKTLDILELEYHNKPIYDRLDNEIEKGNKNIIVDERIKQVNTSKFINDNYEQFRFEFSYFINNPDNIKFRKKIINIMNDVNTDKKEKHNKMQMLIYKIVDTNLGALLAKTLGVDIENLKDEKDDEIYNEKKSDQIGGKLDKIVNIVNDLPNLNNYQAKNERELCEINTNKEQCSTNPYCKWYRDSCKIGITEEMASIYVNKISTELVNNDYKAKELLRIGNYNVSDIKDRNIFKKMEDQEIIVSTSNLITKKLEDMFGKGSIPIIGKRRISRAIIADPIKLNTNNPMKKIGNYYVQKIINENNVIFRAYANGYYWNNNVYDDIESRNLGYYSETQTKLATYFKSQIIDWLLETKNKKIIEQKLIKYFDFDKNIEFNDGLNNFINGLGKNNKMNTNCIVELFILNSIHKYPIKIVDENNDPLYLIDKNNIEIDKKIINKINDDKNTITLRFILVTNKTIPDDIEILHSI